MNVLLQSPGTSQMITLPSTFTPGTSPSDIRHYLECNPPTFPSDNSWDILCPVPASSIITFTRPPFTDRTNIRKEVLVQMRKDLAETRTSIEQFKDFIKKSERGIQIERDERQREIQIERDERQRHVEALKSSQRVLVKQAVNSHILIVRFETYSRLLQVINNDLMSNLDGDAWSQMNKLGLDYITSILEGVYPHGPSEPSLRDQLLRLASVSSLSAGSPILPQFTNMTKRMQLSHNALHTLSEEHVRLAVQLYHILHSLQDSDFQLARTTRNRLQHPRPSIHAAALSLAALVDQVPYRFDRGTATTLIEQEVMKDNGTSESSLFGQTDDPEMIELMKHL